MGLARWQFLVRWHDQFEWGRKPSHPPNQLPYRSDSLDTFEQAPESESQLQRWHVHQVWRELPECLSRVAVFLGGQTELALCSARSLPVPRESASPKVGETI